MKVIVLGGAGYIGSHTVYMLIEQGYEVVIVDNLSTGFEQLIHPKASFYNGDIKDKEFLRSVFSKENIVGAIHFAASSIVPESMQNPLKYYDNNVYGTQVLLEVMNEYNVKNIVFSSSAATYGNVEQSPITEDLPNAPSSAYGETKVVMEKMMKWCDVAHGIKYVALRYFNACGAHSNGVIGELHNPETHLIPLVLQVPLGIRESISVYGNDYNTPDGTCIRDYIHVLDLADAHIKALNYLINGGNSDYFNLGSGTGFSVSEIIEAAERVVGKPIKRVITERRAGDPDSLVASNEKARNILKWELNHSKIDEIIDSAWKFYSNRM